MGRNTYEVVAGFDEWAYKDKRVVVLSQTLPKFKNLTVRIFEKSAHSPQYEEAERFDAELLKWAKETFLQLL